MTGAGARAGEKNPQEGRKRPGSATLLTPQLHFHVRTFKKNSGAELTGGGDVVLPQEDHELLHAVQPTEEKLLLEKMYYLFITAIPGTGTVLAK